MEICNPLFRFTVLESGYGAAWPVALSYYLRDFHDEIEDPIYWDGTQRKLGKQMNFILKTVKDYVEQNINDCQPRIKDAMNKVGHSHDTVSFVRWAGAKLKSGWGTYSSIMPEVGELIKFLKMHGIEKSPNNTANLIFASERVKMEFKEVDAGPLYLKLTEPVTWHDPISNTTKSRLNVSSCMTYDKSRKTLKSLGIKAMEFRIDGVAHGRQLYWEGCHFRTRQFEGHGYHKVVDFVDRPYARTKSYLRLQEMYALGRGIGYFGSDYYQANIDGIVFPVIRSTHSITCFKSDVPFLKEPHNITNDHYDVKLDTMNSHWSYSGSPKLYTSLEWVMFTTTQYENISNFGRVDNFCRLLPKSGTYRPAIVRHHGLYMKQLMGDHNLFKERLLGSPELSL